MICEDLTKHSLNKENFYCPAIFILFGCLAVPAGLLCFTSEILNAKACDYINRLENPGYSFLPGQGLQYFLCFQSTDTDSVFTKKKLAVRTEPSSISGLFYGQLSSGYRYGAGVYTINESGIGKDFFIDGLIGLNFFKLPFTFNFNYSSEGSIYGLRSSFNLSFDPVKYDQKINEERHNKVRDLNKHLEELKGERQDKARSMAYLEVISGESIFTKNKIDNLYIPSSAPDSLINKNDSLFNKDQKSYSAIGDSLSNLPGSELRSVKKELTGLHYPLSVPSRGDSLHTDQVVTLRSDSIKLQLENKKREIERLDKEIAKNQKSIDSLNNLKNAKKTGASPGKFYEWFNYVERLDIGLIYPDFSIFLVNGGIVNGAQMEVQKQNTYFAFLHGKTLNPFLTLVHENSDVLKPLKDIAGSFDGNLNDGRVITCTKFGYGKKNNTHLYFGFLYGKGYDDYFSPHDHSTIENNFVLETEARWDISSRAIINFTYAKSGLSTGVHSKLSEVKSKFLNFSERTNGFEGGVAYSFPKIKSKVNLKGKWVDPFFKSFGIPYLKTDNLKLEGNIEKRINRNIKIAIAYKQERDNILNYFSHHSNIQSFGGTAEARIKKNLQIKLSFNPVFQDLTFPNVNYNLGSDNLINYLIVTYSNRINKKQFFITASINDYRISNHDLQLILQNVLINTNIIWNEKLSSNHYLQIISSTANDIKNYQSIISSEFKIALSPKYDIGSGIKFNNSFLPNTGIGYNFTITSKEFLYKDTYLNLKFEKLVPSDYSSVYASTNNHFDYYTEVKLTYKFD